MLCRFTDRQSGFSEGEFAEFNLAGHVGDSFKNVSANRNLLEDQLGALQFMQQVHGDQIVIIENLLTQEPVSDALITATPGISLAVLVADCIPLLLTSNEVVAAVHVGRRGLENEIARMVIKVMREMGAIEIVAHIGPSICGQCYEVPKELHDQIVASHPAATCQTRKGTHSLDLVAALKVVLFSEEIDQITDLNICTFESSNHFSYRRSGVTGRQAGLVRL